MHQRAIIIVDHGSRAEAANHQLALVAEQLQARFPDHHIAIAHMELAEPSLPAAIDTCVAAGAVEIQVALWFLAPGRHGQHDIPKQVDEARMQYPEVRFHLAQPLGVHPGLIEALAERIAESTSTSRKA